MAVWDSGSKELKGAIINHKESILCTDLSRLA